MYIILQKRLHMLEFQRFIAIKSMRKGPRLVTKVWTFVYSLKGLLHKVLNEHLEQQLFFVA